MNKVGLTTRELWDLRAWLRLNLPIADVNAASRIVMHYIEKFERGGAIDPLVLAYVMQAVNRALSAADGDLGKELGVTRRKPGNTGGVPKKLWLTPGELAKGKTRRLTPAEKDEIFIEFEMEFKRRKQQAGLRKRLRGEGSIRARLIEDLSAEYQTSVRTVEDCLAAGEAQREAEEEYRANAE